MARQHCADACTHDYLNFFFFFFFLGGGGGHSPYFRITWHKKEIASFAGQHGFVCWTPTPYPATEITWGMASTEQDTQNHIYLYQNLKPGKFQLPFPLSDNHGSEHDFILGIMIYGYSAF